MLNTAHFFSICRRCPESYKRWQHSLSTSRLVSLLCTFTLIMNLFIDKSIPIEKMERPISIAATKLLQEIFPPTYSIRTFDRKVSLYKINKFFIRVKRNETILDSPRKLAKKTPSFFATSASHIKKPQQLNQQKTCTLLLSHTVEWRPSRRPNWTHKRYDLLYCWNETVFSFAYTRLSLTKEKTFAKYTTNSLFLL